MSLPSDVRTSSADDTPLDNPLVDATPSSASARSAVRPWWAHTLTSVAGLSSLAVVLSLLVIAVVAPMVWGSAAEAVDPSAARLAPSTTHPFGTDDLGRDILLRVLVGARATLMYTFGAVAISTVLGVGLGLLTAVLGARARQLMYQISATATAFPAILLAVLLATLFGRSGAAAMVGLAIAGVPSLARVTMNLATSTASSDAVVAARSIGVRGRRLVARYILPQVAEPLATLVIMTAASYLVALSALSFVGLGVQAPEWDWGAMLNGALVNIYTNPSAIIGPGLAIVVAGVSFNVLGESLAAGIDPRNRLRPPRKKANGTAHTGTAASVAAVDIELDPTSPALASPTDVDEVLAIEGLCVRASGSDGSQELLQDVSVSVSRGERVAIVGESGSGKSLTLAALARLLPAGVESENASHRFFGAEIGRMSNAETARALGVRLSMVFQDPMSTLNPALTIGSIMADKIPKAERSDRATTRQRLAAALAEVGIADPETKLDRHPHELSGGQRQRVMIAIALLGDTQVLLADEPTTALDVSVQAQIAELLLRISREREMAFVVVSHDLALVSQLADRIVVMYRGRVVEDGSTEQVLTAPRHPYTRFLLASVPAHTDQHIDAGSDSSLAGSSLLTEEVSQ